VSAVFKNLPAPSLMALTGQMRNGWHVAITSDLAACPTCGADKRKACHPLDSRDEYPAYAHVERRLVAIRRLLGAMGR